MTVSLTHLLVLLFAGAGITDILLGGFIIGPLRLRLAKGERWSILGLNISKYLIELLNCPMCLGFWVGLTLEILLGGGLITRINSDGFCGILTWGTWLFSLFVAGATVSWFSNFTRQLVTKG